ncbi:MAG: GNAT family protein [Verrucomicrobiota bacterium]
MKRTSDQKAVVKRQREQMLKLVSKGFYKELINYGVQKDEILRVASHLLDNLMAQENQPGEGVRYYNDLFTLDSVTDEWKDRRRLAVQHVALRPLEPADIPLVAAWLRDRAVRESFVPAFPESEAALKDYFAQAARQYFAILYDGRAVGIVGGENVDPAAGKLEMKKLVGEPGLQGKGIGKRATFAFLYYTFMILNFHKVYLHSRDINVHNLNLNSRFGFELEGIFFDDITIAGCPQDIVRMALFKAMWVRIFARRGVEA